MKQFYLLTCLLIFMSANLNAQTTDVVTGFSYPYALALNGNELFISDIDGGTLSKIDITETTPTVIDVVTGITGINGMAVNGNYLYFSDLPNNKISKLDITSATPTVTDVVTDVIGPVGLAFKGNELYIAEWGAGKISKIDDVTASSLVVTDVVDGLTNPVGLVFKGDELFITEPMSNTVADKIHKINTTENSPELTEVLTGVSGPRGVVFSGDILYIAEASAGKISKLNLVTVSINQIVENNSPMTIFPNPATNTIQVSGLTRIENYKIYNVLGKQILEGNITNAGNINIISLTKGVYFFKLDNRIALRFIKK